MLTQQQLEKEMEQAKNELDASRQKEPMLKKALDAFGNMFALNVCFVIGCLPLFTIGASVTALYAMCIRLQEGEEETVVAGFIHEFKRSFKQATQAFLIIVAALFFMFFQFAYVNNFSGAMARFYICFLILEVIAVALVLVFLFPLIARYDNTLLLTFRNSVVLAITYFGSWFKIGLAWVAPVLFFVIYPELILLCWYLWILIIFGAIAWGCSHSIRKIFGKNEERMEEAKRKAAEEAEENEDVDSGAPVKNNKEIETGKSKTRKNKTEKNSEKDKDSKTMTNVSMASKANINNIKRTK